MLRVDSGYSLFGLPSPTPHHLMQFQLGTDIQCKPSSSSLLQLNRRIAIRETFLQRDQARFQIVVDVGEAQAWVEAQATVGEFLAA